MNDYGARIRKAYRDWHDANDPKTMSWAEITRRGAKLLGVPESSFAVLKMKAGLQEPTTAEYRVLAEILEADLGWLALELPPGRVQLPAREPSIEKPVVDVVGRRRPRRG